MPPSTSMQKATKMNFQSHDEATLEIELDAMVGALAAVTMRMSRRAQEQYVEQSDVDQLTILAEKVTTAVSRLLGESAYTPRPFHHVITVGVG